MRPERRIWVRPTDDRGNPVDPRLEQAAYAIEGAALAYRQDELRDDTCAITLLEAAVRIGSRAARQDQLASPAAYLRRIFQRLVDAEVENRRRLVSIEAVALDQEVAARDGRIEDIERSLLVESLLERLDLETRDIVEARMFGKGVAEIARDLGVTPNCVSQRLKNGFERLRKGLHFDR